MYQSYIFMNLKTSGNPVSINIPGIPEGFLKMEHMGFEPPEISVFSFVLWDF